MDLNFIMDIPQHEPVVNMAIAWLLPAATLIAGALGYKSSKDANKTQQNAINAQQSAEAQKTAMAQEQVGIADRLMATAEPQANQWTQDYLSWLKSSPDITYNAQRGQMEGNIKTSMEQAARAMGQRGLTGGVSASNMAGIGMQRTGLLANLEGQRYDRQGQNLATGSQITQSLMDRALNARSAATGNVMNQQTQIPGMLQQKAAGQSTEAGAYGNLAGGLINSYLGSQQTTTPSTYSPMAGYTPLPTYGNFQFKNQ